MRKMARSATVTLGKVGMSIDPQLFYLNECNKFHLSCNITEFCKLDRIMGRRWNIKPHMNEDPNSFFYHVSNIVIFIDKNNNLKVRLRYTGSNFPVCKNYRQRTAKSLTVHSAECLASDSAVDLS